MKVVDLTVDVYSVTDNVVYRLYVDDTLMTERTFIWPTWKNYVEEHMHIQVEAGTTHTVRVESANTNLRIPDHVSIKNLIVGGSKLKGKTFTV